MRYKVTYKGQSAVKYLSSNRTGLLMDLMINNINTAIVHLMTMAINGSHLTWLTVVERIQALVKYQPGTVRRVLCLFARL